MIEDEKLIRSYLDNTLKNTERTYVNQRLKSDAEFLALFDDISLYYDSGSPDKPNFAKIPVQPLPKKYLTKVLLMNLIKVIIVVTIVWTIMHFLFRS